jgi:hypothetical protein
MAGPGVSAPAATWSTLESPIPISAIRLQRRNQLLRIESRPPASYPRPAALQHRDALVADPFLKNYCLLWRSISIMHSYFFLVLQNVRNRPTSPT